VSGATTRTVVALFLPVVSLFLSFIIMSLFYPVRPSESPTNAHTRVRSPAVAIVAAVAVRCHQSINVSTESVLMYLACANNQQYKQMLTAITLFPWFVGWWIYCLIDY
jgi:hypothetical protein